MTPDQLRAFCDSLNPGGQTELAGMMGWTTRTMRNKLAGKTPITKADAMAISHVMECDNSSDSRSF